MNALLFKDGMRRLAAGVSLITTVNNGERHGLVATSVTSLTADPPSLLVCINRNASAHVHIAQSGILSVNVLSNDQRAVADRFSIPADRDLRFDTGVWERGVTGAPLLVGSQVSFDCEIRETMNYGSHSIFLAEIMTLELWAAELKPLLYHDGQYRDLREHLLASAGASGG